MIEPTNANPAKLEVYRVSALAWLESLTVAAVAKGRKQVLISNLEGEQVRIVDAHEYMAMNKETALVLAIADPPTS